MVKIPTQTFTQNELPPNVAVIEQLKTDDIKSYLDFFRKVVSDLEEYTEEEKESAFQVRNLEDVEKKLQNNDWVFLIAKDNKGQIIASIEGRILKFKSGLVGNVLWVLIDKLNRNKTIGDRMSKEFEEVAISKGCNRFLLLIKDDNNISIKMHTKRGYVGNTSLEPKVDGSTWYVKKV